MATVTKDFKVKNGIKVQGDANIDASLYVGGPNATVNGSDIITEDIITGGTQTNISVTYDAQSKTLNFVAENGVADSTTADLAEDPAATGTSGTQYFTDARAVTAVEAAATTSNTPNKIVKRNGDGTIYAGDIHGTLFGLVGPSGGSSGYLGRGGEGVVSLVSLDGDLLLESANGSDVYLESVEDGNQVTTKSDIDALTTSDIEEGTNLYFTNQRAIDAIGGSATPDNIPNSVVKRDSNGSFSAENITANDVTLNNVIFEDNGGSIGTDSTGLNIFAPSGDVNLAAQTGQVKIGGSQVTTAENEQTLTNKTVGGALAFDDGQNTSSITVTGDDLEVMAYNDLTLTATTGNLVLRPDPLNEVGKAYVGSTNIANEIATKAYVDATAEGLHVKPAVLSATTQNLVAVYDNGTNGIDATLTISATATLDIDGQTSWEVGDGVLVKNQTNAFENGRYYVTIVGDSVTDWVLKRCMFCDEADEIPSSYVFVQGGSTYGSTGWLATVENPSNFVVGQDDIIWNQFSGAGTYTAGFGLDIDGTTFSVDTNEIATAEALGNAVGDLTDYVDGFLNSNDGTVIEYIDDQDSATLLAANTYSADLVATGDATATPQYLAINVNDVAKQVAATSSILASTPSTAYSFSSFDYRSAEFLVKLAYGTHTEVSKVILTLDTSDNVAITEYAIVGTNGSLSAITAVATNGTVDLQVTPVNDSTVTVVGTLLV